MSNERDVKEAFIYGILIGIGLATLGFLIVESYNSNEMKNIASPLISLLALCLAGYSAYKVSKWVDSKLNESKYKTIDEIIDYETQIKYYATKALYYIKKIPRNKDDNSVKDNIKEISECSEKVRENLVLIHQKSYKLERIYHDENNKLGLNRINDLDNIVVGIEALRKLSVSINTPNLIFYIRNHYDDMVSDRCKEVVNEFKDNENILFKYTSQTNPLISEYLNH